MNSLIAGLASRAAALHARIAAHFGVRTLVNEILSLQMVLTAVVGLIAIAGLFWTSQGIVVNNVNRWAIQWVDDLHELGAPLYLGNDSDAFVNVERFANRYPELTRVTYFDPEGRFKWSIQGREHQSTGPRGLPRDIVDSLSYRAGSDAAFTMSQRDVPGQFVIRSAIWTEAIAGDGLFALEAADAASDIQTLGFVQLDLDFASYFDKIESNAWFASLLLLALLLSMALVSRVLLKRSLRSLSSLQAPIAKLAQGDLDVKFPDTPHREISAIVETLQRTVESLRQRDSKLMRLANHDSLTGLFNRQRFVDELHGEIERAERGGLISAMLFIDLDQFKYVNDTCGHPAGDKLLICAAEQLKRCVRKSDSVSRFGGDEFAVLVRNVSRREAKAIGMQILAQMRDFAHVESQHVFQLQCSIGITMINGGRCTADEVMAQADVACHEAKRRGRNRMEFYRVSAKETEQMIEDVGWTQRIKEGLAENRFVLYYQPIVHIATGRTTHHEVLLRLQLPDGRTISPSAFLPAAERFGLMLDLDRWVIENSIAALAQLRSQTPALRFTVNLSAHAFEDKNLHVRVRQLLEAHQVPPDHVVFEITEQVAIRNIADVERQLTLLKSLGCKVAIDDFGTGYSSFSHLKRFRFDYLKIDGAFVESLARDPVDQTMVRLFADIGKGLGVQTIAEYVTEATAFALLAKFGIDYGQGYFLSRPTPQPEFPQVPIPIEIRQRKALRSSAVDADTSSTANRRIRT